MGFCCLRPYVRKKEYIDVFYSDMPQKCGSFVLTLHLRTVVDNLEHGTNIPLRSIKMLVQVNGQ